MIDTRLDEALNSATKYPSIPTYHHLEGGRLTERPAVYPPGDIVVTEKVDGTNARIIVDHEGDWVIGNRNSLLAAKGDRITNPAESIVATLRPLITRLRGGAVGDGWLAVLYGEVYGGKIGGQAKQYSSTGATGFRLFDIAYVPTVVLPFTALRAAEWRDSGGQMWASETVLRRAANEMEIELTPRLVTATSADLPFTLPETEEWMSKLITTTDAALDDNAGKKPEGLVIRTIDRSTVHKLRFADYANALRPQQKGRRKAPVA